MGERASSESEATLAIMLTVGGIVGAAIEIECDEESCLNEAPSDGREERITCFASKCG